MSPEQFVAVMAGFTAMIGAMAVLISAIHNYHTAVNSKMDKLLELNSTAARAAGKLEAEEAHRSAGDR